MRKGAHLSTSQDSQEILSAPSYLLPSEPYPTVTLQKTETPTGLISNLIANLQRLDGLREQENWLAHMARVWEQGESMELLAPATGKT